MPWCVRNYRYQSRAEATETCSLLLFDLPHLRNPFPIPSVNIRKGAEAGVQGSGGDKTTPQKRWRRLGAGWGSEEGSLQDSEGGAVQACQEKGRTNLCHPQLFPTRSMAQSCFLIPASQHHLLQTFVQMGSIKIKLLGR